MIARIRGSDVALDAPAAPRATVPLRSRLGSFVVSREFVWLLIALGAALRLRQYLLNRSLWLDESFLGLNLIERSWHELFEPLQFNQASPPAFLAVEKLAISAFGNSEYALRAFPLLCGLAALPLFALFARRLLAPAAIPAALALFVFSDELVYYSSEVKPYIVDVVAALVLSLFALSFARDGVTKRNAVVGGLTGAVLIQVSYAGMFVAAGVGATLFAERALRRAWRDLRLVCVAAAFWAASAGLFLWLYGRNLTKYTFEGEVFAELPTSRENVTWWATPLKAIAALVGVYPGWHGIGRPILVLAGLLCAVGAVVFFMRKRLMFVLLTAPVVPMLVASVLDKYPILPRTVMFLLPAVLVFLGSGIVAVGTRLRARQWVAVAALTIAVVVYPAVSSAEQAATPTTYENIKWALRYVADHWKQGDVLYLHYPSQFAFAYYDECDCFELPRTSAGERLWRVRRAAPAQPWVQMPRALNPANENVIVGRFAGDYYRGIYRSDVERVVRHRRAWILMTFIVSEDEVKFIRRDLLGRLARRGRRVLALERPSARLYLYEFEKR